MATVGTHNADGENVDMYIPRKCGYSGCLLSASDHAAVQISIGDVDSSGVYTGNTYLFVATADAPGGGGSDAAHQQIAAVTALGSEYVSPGVPTRRQDMGVESVVYRMVGVVDGTTLTYDPLPPPGAPTTLNLAQVAEFETTA